MKSVRWCWCGLALFAAACATPAPPPAATPTPTSTVAPPPPELSTIVVPIRTSLAPLLPLITEVIWRVGAKLCRSLA